MKQYIEEIEVKDHHIGCCVTYIPRHADGNISHPDVEHGHLSSFNENGVWVRFKAQCGAKCDTSDLVWG